MLLPLIALDRVLHVGSLDPARRGERHATSYEGGGLSVSPCPRAWRAMASLEGPTWRLDRPGALWLDLLALGNEGRGAAVLHGEPAGLVAVGPVWRAWVWEEDRQGWASLERREEVEARDIGLNSNWVPPGGERTVEAVLAALPEGTPPPPGGRLWERVELPLLTEAGNARALGFGRWRDAGDMAAMFWAEDVLRGAEPDLVGVWWREPYRPRADQAPRGAVLPACVAGFAAGRAGRTSDMRELAAVPGTAWREVDVPAAGRCLA